MTDNTVRRPEDSAAEPEVPGAEPGLSRAEQVKIAALVETLARENAEHKDRLLRTLAEMENLRKRTEREVADMRAVRHRVVRPRRAGGRRQHGARARGARRRIARDREPRRQGAARRRRADRARTAEGARKHGVKKFEPQKGDKFDPNLHQAMYELPDPSQPAGTVAQVVQPGYMIGERMLRPALVGVAKGGPKAAPANDNPDAARRARRATALTIAALCLSALKPALRQAGRASCDAAPSDS